MQVLLESIDTYAVTCKVTCIRYIVVLTDYCWTVESRIKLEKKKCNQNQPIGNLVLYIVTDNI